jgi:hypothetical protein
MKRNTALAGVSILSVVIILYSALIMQRVLAAIPFLAGLFLLYLAYVFVDENTERRILP